MYNSPRPQLFLSFTPDGIADSELHLAIAKDSQVPIGTRMRAAGDMVSDKMDQHSHEVTNLQPSRLNRMSY